MKKSLISFILFFLVSLVWAEGTHTPEKIFLRTDVMPTFNGGNRQGFINWVAGNVTYPYEAIQEGIEGKVVAQFVIEKDGAVNHVEIISSPSQLLSEEVIKTIESSPAWNPGINEDKPVRTQIIIPIDFSLSSIDPYFIENGGPVTKVDNLPSFRDGDFKAFRNWVAKNIDNHKIVDRRGRYVYGKSVLFFTIDTEGNLTDIDVIEETNDIITKEVIRVLKLSPQWTPGEDNGIKVPVSYTLPVILERR